jgi:anti-sigma factor ChrR (cupin superfamily)
MPDGAETPMRKRLTADEPSPRSVFLDVPNMPWEETKFPGIRCKTLYSDGSGMATLLLELEPGAEVPLHEHTAIEQTYVLKGHFIDEEGECLPGQFVWRPAGNTHVAWAGKEGATILGVFLKPNIFADGRPFFTAEQKK